MSKENKKIVLALSGGVDSSIAAHFLKEQGYEVTAIFMQNWDDYFANSYTQNCSQNQDWQIAKSAAEQLGIKIVKIDFIKEYWEEVFSKFLQQLKEGMTPNPDILCNNVIKFNFFVKYVKKNFACSLIATGHYAKIKKLAGKSNLCKPKDILKDQTYFLCGIEKKVLPEIIFPLEKITKEEVRKVAKDLDLINSERKGSTGICFIGERNFENFLANYFPKKEGLVIEWKTNRVVGKHKGVFFYTLGQRRNLGISGEANPYYVAGKNIEENKIFVVENYHNEALYSHWCLIKNVNWLIEKETIEKILQDRKGIKAKFRYGQKEVEIELEKLDDKLENFRINCKEKQRSITPGQYAAFYWQDLCLGGAMIQETEKNYSNGNLKN